MISFELPIYSGYLSLRDLYNLSCTSRTMKEVIPDLNATDIRLIALFSRIVLFSEPKKPKLTGRIPVQAEKIRLWMKAHPKQLLHLWNLNLSSLYLTELPPEFNRYIRVTHLDLSRNWLTELPGPEVLTPLNTLNLRHNCLQYIPYTLLEKVSVFELRQRRSYQTSLLETLIRISKLREHTILRCILLTMHDVNIIWRSDLRKQVIENYNKSLSDEPLPTEWKAAYLDKVYKVNVKRLYIVFGEVAKGLSCPSRYHF